jgi:hypothetical protein
MISQEKQFLFINDIYLQPLQLIKKHDNQVGEVLLKDF